MARIELDGGKYTVLHENGCKLRALRNGEEWRTLTGDGLILAMAQRIEDLTEALTENQDCLVKCLTGGEVSAKRAGKAIEKAALLLEPGAA